MATTGVGVSWLCEHQVDVPAALEVRDGLGDSREGRFPRARKTNQRAESEVGRATAAGSALGGPLWPPRLAANPDPSHSRATSAAARPLTDLVAAPDEHVAPVADGYVAAALGGAGELHGLIALEGWPRQVVRPHILVAISHLEAALLLTRNAHTRKGPKKQRKRREMHSGARQKEGGGERDGVKASLPLALAFTSLLGRGRLSAAAGARLQTAGPRAEPGGGGAGPGPGARRGRDPGLAGSLLQPVRPASCRPRPCLRPDRKPPVPLTPPAELRKRGCSSAPPAPSPPAAAAVASARATAYGLGTAALWGRRLPVALRVSFRRGNHRDNALNRSLKAAEF